jgi:hypothetical protein
MPALLLLLLLQDAHLIQGVVSQGDMQDMMLLQVLVSGASVRR